MHTYSMDVVSDVVANASLMLSWSGACRAAVISCPETPEDSLPPKPHAIDFGSPPRGR